jgi:Xaa-Pro dipeptidase
MSTIHGARRATLRAKLHAAELDGILVTNLVNIRYLTGFTGSNAALVVSSDSDEHSVFITDGRYTTQAAAEVDDLRRETQLPPWSDHLGIIGKLGLSSLGFEGTHVTVSAHKALAEALTTVELRNAAGLIEKIREVKDASEIASIARACEIADEALRYVIEHGKIRAGVSELHLARALEFAMLEHGAKDKSFDSIVAFGEHSAIPHHQPTGKILALGDFVKLDFGAQVDGYHSDMTRTLVLGEPDQWQRDLYDLVAVAQAAGCAAVAPGAELQQVDVVARGVLADAGYELVHGLGHGVGLVIHEAPFFTKTGSAKLENGMAVTVEPGVYLAGRGGVRIEDTLVVREGVPELLTMTTKDLLVV